MPWTLILLGTATIVATVIGVWIGIRAGWKRGSRFDKVSTGVTLFLYATPEFWLGLILILVFSTGIGPFPGVFPSGSSIGSGLDPWTLEGIISIAYHTVLPACALAAVYLADYSLIMRASMVDELGQDYLTTARAKGLMDRAIRRGHAVPNASLPTITLIFLNIGFVFGGAITVETVFSYPGLGSADAGTRSRARTSRSCRRSSCLFSVTVIVFNIIADIVIAVVDPRIRRMTAAEHRAAGRRDRRGRSPGSAVAMPSRGSSAPSPAHRTGMFGVGILVFFIVVALDRAADLPRLPARPEREPSNDDAGAPELRVLLLARHATTSVARCSPSSPGVRDRR